MRISQSVYRIVRPDVGKHPAQAKVKISMSENFIVRTIRSGRLVFGYEAQNLT